MFSFLFNSNITAALARILYRSSILVLMILLLIQATSAQTKQSINGDWVKVSATYADGSELEDQQTFKYSYLKYSFLKPNKAFMVTDFLNTGSAATYSSHQDQLTIMTDLGIPIEFKVVYLSPEKLIVIQKELQGFDDPNAMKLTFLNEKVYQKTVPFKAQDIIVYPNNDTIYKATEKVHPTFIDKGAFNNYLDKQMPSYKKYLKLEAPKNSFFAATFIVRKSGVIDSIHIIQGLDEAFDREFLLACKKSAKKWRPGILNDQPIDTRVTFEQNFNFLDNGIKDRSFRPKADAAFDNGDYEKALYFYNKLIEHDPRNEKAIITRGKCYLSIGNLEAACEDFQRLKDLGYESGEVLRAKYCVSK